MSIRTWAGAGAVTVAAFAFVTSEFLPVGLLPQLARDFGLSDGTAALTITAPGMIATIAAPLCTVLVARLDRRNVLAILTTVLIGASLLSAAARTFATLLVGRCLFGASLGGFWAVALGVAGRLAGTANAAKSTALMFAGITLATIVGVPLGTWIGGTYSWQISFIGTAIAAAAALAGIVGFVPSLPATKAIRFADFYALLGRSGPRRSVLLIALIIASHFSGYAFIATFLDAEAFSLSGISALLLAFGAVGFIANFAVTHWVDRYLIGSISSAVTLLLMSMAILPALSFSTPSTIAVILLWGIAYGAIPVCINRWMAAASPDDPEVGSAIFVATYQIAIALGSFAGGRAVNYSTANSAMWLGALIALMALAMIYSFTRKDRQRFRAIAS